MLKKYESLANKNYNDNNVTKLNLEKPSIEDSIKLTDQTRKALEEKITGKIKSSGMLNGNITNDNGAKYIRYTPNQQGLGHNSNAGQRIIRLTELPKDPLEQTKFKHKKIPSAANEEPVPVMHSLTRKLTREDQLAWNIPPCVSNWKNAKGFTIPLEMRLSADGRNLKNFSVSEKFSKFADVLYITEKQARKEIEERNKLQDSIKMMDNIKKERELSEAAKEAREKKIAMAVSNISSVMTHKTDDTDILIGKKTNRYDEPIPQMTAYDQKLEDEKQERNKLRNIRKKEIERDRRIEVAGTKKAKLTRDVDRDISEKIALGQAQPSKESMVDARLYNQVTGLESGFKEEEDYDLYDKPLFVDRTQASIFKNVRAGSGIDDDSRANDVSESKKLMEKIYKRGNMFEGADITINKGGKPIEFESTQEEYGLNDIHKKKPKK